MSDQIITIFSQFATQGSFGESTLLTLGHINQTFFIKTIENDKPNYLLQQMNHNIFKNIDYLQENIFRVTNHIRQKLQNIQGSQPNRQVLTIIPTTSNKLYYQDIDGNFWRLFIYIEHKKSYNQVLSAKLAKEGGFAFANFQAQLADLGGEPLHETIPNFHNMEFRMQQFNEAIEQNAAQRIDKIKSEIAEILKRASEMTCIDRLGREGKLPKRITHCDTKFNNILFDENDRALCIIDLDTVMPGYVLSDFGDAIRTGATTAAEDEQNISKVSMNIDLFKAYTQGYIAGAKKFLTGIEIEYLAFGAKLLTYMQAVRFFTDYINGDTYYKTVHPEHNLQRTHAQLALLYSIEKQYDTMRTIVDDSVNAFDE